MPVVAEYGSLGCSGDLAPLAACALALTGEGLVRGVDGVRRPAAEALATIEDVERRAPTYPLLWNVKAQALADLGRADGSIEFAS